MILPIFGILLLGTVMFIFLRKDGLKMTHAIVCALFGFYLAGTTLVPTIQATGTSLATVLGGFRF